MLLISIIGVIAIYIIFKIRYKETLLKYKDKFIEHSVHEIKTPLAIIKGNLDMLLRWGKDDPDYGPVRSVL